MRSAASTVGHVRCRGRSSAARRAASSDRRSRVATAVLGPAIVSSVAARHEATRRAAARSGRDAGHARRTGQGARRLSSNCAAQRLDRDGRLTSACGALMLPLIDPRAACRRGCWRGAVDRAPARCCRAGVRRLDVDRLQIGAAADQLARVAARLLEQHRQVAADAVVVEGALLSFEQRLQRASRSALTGSGTCGSQLAAGVPGRGLYLNEKAWAKPIVVDQARASPRNRRRVSPGKPTMKSELTARCRGGRARSRSTSRR